MILVTRKAVWTGSAAQIVAWLLLVSFMSGCARDKPLFTRMPPASTGITFENRVVEQEGFNVLEYEYFYNGAGVAAGDINNDGRPDLYFTSNMGPDYLYLNRGDWTFDDITESAGMLHQPTWTTGVTMVDINADGWLDVYVCRSGNVAPERRRNALYINNGDLTFSEQAARYGLDDVAYSNHATFFDYDLDGDLDMYLLNHSIRRFSRFVVEYMRAQRDSLAGDKLFRNDGGVFTDVSEQAGIIGNPLGFGLSVVVSDIDGDSWPDLYVSNDYIEDDYLYINQRDGTFAESVRAWMSHTSYSSMGADIADINNDLRVDIVTLDMLAEDNYRQKVLKGPEDHVFYAKFREDGFHEQYMRNMLQLRYEDDFIEIGQLAGISNTDWSWAALLMDFDLDGYKDLFVTNGYLRDYTNLDFLKTTLPNSYAEASRHGQTLSSLEMVRHMPRSPIANYMFRGQDGITFSDQTDAWGLNAPSYANGAVWADLDGDLDADLVVSNINEPPSLYRNEAEGLALKINLEGPPGNTQGIGASVTLSTGSQQFFQELQPVRGYLSSVEPVLIFGTRGSQAVDISVAWPDGRVQMLEGVPAGEALTVRYTDAQEPANASSHSSQEPEPIFRRALDIGPAFVHVENPFVDYESQPLLPYMLSREGPAMAAGDLNLDGLEDVFVGGAHGQASTVYLQQLDRTFTRVSVPALEEHSEYEDVAALLQDLDGDNDLDLYVVSGGAWVEGQSKVYQDRIYINSGFGRLEYAPSLLPSMPASGGDVAAHDFDRDGDVDLFIGGRHLPGSWPETPRSYLLTNTPDGFVDVTPTVLQHVGMVTSATWADVSEHSGQELIIAGGWMPVRVFARGTSGRFLEITEELKLGNTDGFWNILVAADLDRDGDMDLVGGNRGLNAQLKVDSSQPASVYAGDLDRSGTWDLVLSGFVMGLDVPVASRDQMIAQLPGMGAIFPTYASYAAASMRDLTFDRDGAVYRQVTVSTSSVFEKLPNGTFRQHPLPTLAQISPVKGLLAADYNGDGHMDLLLGGNNYGNRAEDGRMNAGRGLLLLGDGHLGFRVRSYSGFQALGEVRHLLEVNHSDQRLILVGRNNSFVDAYM